MKSLVSLSSLHLYSGILLTNFQVLISLISLISTAPAPQEEEAPEAPEAPEALPYVHEEIEALPYVHDDTGGKGTISSTMACWLDISYKFCCVDVSDDSSPEALPYVHEEIDALPYVHEEIDALPYEHSEPAMPAMPAKPVLTVGVLQPVLSYSALPLISYHGTGCLNSKGSVVPCLI